MELIIRVTGKCNFDCSFCSAANMNIMHPKHGVPEQIKDVINTIKPDFVIISGGEPTLVDPSYYYELHDICNCMISMTTNLKEFYYHPEKWAPLFKEDWIGVITSFNYGDTRKWDKDTIYTEDKFIEIYQLYQEYVGRCLNFIAVIDETNEDTVLDLVKLAKRLDTRVRLNNAVAQGRQETTYPRYKIIQKYFEILDAGYCDYEIQTDLELINKCPINKSMLCQKMIRTCYVDTKNQLHYYHCDTANHPIELDYKQDDFSIETVYPCISEHVNEKCALCPLFTICNGCQVQKEYYPPEHCKEMLKMMDKFKEYKWI